MIDNVPLPGMPEPATPQRRSLQDEIDTLKRVCAMVYITLDSGTPAYMLDYHLGCLREAVDNAQRSVKPILEDRAAWQKIQSSVELPGKAARVMGTLVVGTED